ncbi:MAG: hypothetical protein V4690_02215 [Patescibacteria group bacterium]
MIERMENINNEEPSLKFKKFKEVFTYISSNNLDQKHIEAYDYAVGIAKKLVETKNKSEWNRYLFSDELAKTYPSLSADFISTLVNCIENYNPPANIPNEPLW